MISDKRSTKRSRAKGFTLIEVIVSLTIMAMIMTVAFTGLSIGLDSWTRGTKQIEKLEDRANVERLLYRQLALAYPTVFRVKPSPDVFVLFRGSSTRVEFVSNYSLIDGATDFRKIGYRFDGKFFRYEEKSLFGYAPSDDESIDGRSIAALRLVHFRFLKPAKKSEPAAESTWADEWKFGDGLPLAVEVRIEEDVIVVPLVNGA